MKAITKHLRLLPAVIVVAGGLLALKSSDLVQEARAAAADGPAPAAAVPEKLAQAKTADPALDDDSDSASEIDVLTSLGKRRRALDAQSRELDMRSNLLAAAEKRIDSKIADLKALQTQIQGLLGERDEAQKKQIAALVKVYTAMKPKDAGRIFNTLDESVLIDVANGMKPDVLAGIMAAMNGERAQELTEKLADRLKLPKAAELATAPVPQQSASLTPPPGAAPATPGAPPAASPSASPGQPAGK